MAADSLFGGSTDLAANVSTQSLSLINKFLTDTVGTSAITAAIGQSTLVVGSGSAGEKQGALLPATTTVSGSIDDGVLKLTISVPANSGFVFEGKDNVTPANVGTFLGSVIDAYLPPAETAHAAVRASLNAAVNDLVSAMNAQGVTDVVVRVVDFVSARASGSGAVRDVGASEILFDTTASTGNELLAFNLGQLGAGQSLVIKGVENALVTGEGSVRVEGDAAARITSDLASQSITGGGGNDTIIGGGGSDTLAGGAGDDTFGFARLGHFTVSDLAAGDKIAFDVAGVTNVAQLAALVTSVHQGAEGVTYHFGANASITLVGLSMFDVTSDMLAFSF